MSAPPRPEEQDRRYVADPTRHLGLVVMLAKRYAPPGPDRDDLIGAGMLGLIRAAHRYDPGRRIRFSSYARRVILGHFWREIARRPLIAVPQYAWDAALVKHRGGQPRINPKHLAAAEQAMRQHVSLCPNGQEEWLAAPDPTEATDQEFRIAAAAQLRVRLDRLPPRHRFVLVARFGLDGAPPRRIREIAAELAISNQAVSYFQKQAIELLRRRVAPSRGPRAPGPQRGASEREHRTGTGGAT